MFDELISDFGREDPMKLGIIGCGVISRIYVRDLQRLYSDLVSIEAVANASMDKAKKLAEEFQIPACCSVDELLERKDIELVINLTPPKVHTEINRKILNAGKHVFCEKPFALSIEEAEEIFTLAESKGLYAGSAPDTFLGSAMTTCRKLLQDGWIGKPLYVTANMMTSGVETWHPSPEPFYSEGGGPIYDMGAYYLTVLVSMFGPVKRLISLQGKGFDQREIYNGPRKGEVVDVQVPTYYAVLMEMENGVRVNMNFSFDIWKSSLPLFEVYGTEGTMMVPDPNHHGGVPKIYRKEQKLAACMGGDDHGNGEAFAMPEVAQDVGEYVRGLGVAEMVRAIQEHRPAAVGKEMTLHVLDVLTGILKSGESQTWYEVGHVGDKCMDTIRTGQMSAE